MSLSANSTVFVSLPLSYVEVVWWDGYLVGTWVPSTVMVSLAHTSPPPFFAN